MSLRTTRLLRTELAALLVVAATLVSASVASPAEAASSAWFSSPSRNIGCYMTTTWVRCDVISRTWVPTRKPASCDFAWGPAVEVGLTGKGHFGCVSDTVGGSSRILRYGKSITTGVFRCTSRSTDMTCTNTANGHGFRVSRAAYRFF
jgi:hypothetical protein